MVEEEDEEKGNEGLKKIEDGRKGILESWRRIEGKIGKEKEIGIMRKKVLGCWSGR